MDVLKIIGKQFKKPQGLLGMIISGIMKKGNRQDYEKLIPQLEIRPNERLLEIGYGHGMGVKMILSRYDCHITGVDFSRLMFREASRRNRKNIAAGKAELLPGDFLDIGMKPNQFDKIYCVHVVYFWDQLSVPFGKIYSLLRDGGMFCTFIVRLDFMNKMKFTKDGIFNRYFPEEVSEELKKAGFSEVRTSENKKGFVITGKK